MIWLLSHHKIQISKNITPQKLRALEDRLSDWCIEDLGWSGYQTKIEWKKGKAKTKQEEKRRVSKKKKKKKKKGKKIERR